MSWNSYSFGAKVTSDARVKRSPSTLGVMLGKELLWAMNWIRFLDSCWFRWLWREIIRHSRLFLYLYRFRYRFLYRFMYRFLYDSFRGRMWIFASS